MRPIISSNIRVRYPESFVVGEDSVIDDFSYFSTRVHVGMCSHIASGCTIAGGPDYEFRLGDFSSLSAGARVWCASNDYTNDLVVLAPREAGELGDEMIVGDVVIGDYTGVGSNTVIMPANTIPEGTVVGALSFVPPRFLFEPWSVYVGAPIRLVGRRNRPNVLAQAETLRARLAERKA